MIKERTELATPALSGLLDFWLTKCLGDQPPAPSSIAPADLRPWKENIVIFEVIGDDDFVYSYYGKALAEAFGHSRLGATLDDLPEEQRAILRPEYETVRRERQPVARVYTADFSGVMRTWERLVLPMSSDGGHIDKLLVAAYEMIPADSAPAPINPASTDPAAADPVSADQATADVAPDDPVSADLAPVDPVSADLVSTDLAPTDQASSDQASTDQNSGAPA